MRNQDVLLPEVVNILVILRPRTKFVYVAIIPWHPVNNYNIISNAYCEISLSSRHRIALVPSALVRYVP